MIEEKHCLNLGRLYGFLESTYVTDVTEYGYRIRREDAPDGQYYYTLEDGEGLPLCSDGEECVVTDRGGCTVCLVSAANLDDEEVQGIDVTFSLTVKEFTVAIGPEIEMVFKCGGQEVGIHPCTILEIQNTLASKLGKDFFDSFGKEKDEVLHLCREGKVQAHFIDFRDFMEKMEPCVAGSMAAGLR